MTAQTKKNMTIAIVIALVLAVIYFLFIKKDKVSIIPSITVAAGNETVETAADLTISEDVITNEMPAARMVQ